MIQMNLFDWQPPSPPTVFPYHRRMDVLREIADVFVRDGYDAGNSCMMRHGCAMIADLHKSGMGHEAIGVEINKFTAAAREHSTRAIVNAGRCGDDPMPPHPQPQNPTRRTA